MQKLELDKPRDLGQIIGDTFTYIRVHNVTLLKPFAVYVLPSLLLAALLLGGGLGSLFGTAFQDPVLIESDPSQVIGSGAAVFFGIVAVFITTWLLLAVVHQHMMHTSKGDVPANLSEFSRGMFLKSLILVAIYIGIAVPLYFLMIILFLILQEFVFIAIMVFFPLMIYIAVKLMLFPAAYFIENSTPVEALRRSWDLTRDNFWITFGVYFVIALIFGMLSYLMIIPVLIIFGLIVGIGDGALDQNMGAFMGVVYAVMYFFQLIFSSAQFISLGLHFFNLRERKDGSGLRSQIDQL